MVGGVADGVCDSGIVCLSPSCGSVGDGADDNASPSIWLSDSKPIDSEHSETSDDEMVGDGNGSSKTVDSEYFLFLKAGYQNPQHWLCDRFSAMMRKKVKHLAPKYSYIILERIHGHKFLMDASNSVVFNGCYFVQTFCLKPKT